MLHNLSLFKKLGTVVFLIYCFLLLEFSVPLTFLKRSTLSEFVIHEMSFLNFTLNYKYIMMPGLSLCDGSREHIPLIVATVISTSNRTETRRAIRETWASPRESQAIKTGRVLVFFLLSAPLSIHELYVLRKEQKKHNDLIVTDLPETYENLVFKVYASMVFHQQYCPMARFLMKVDDDVVVHLDRMLELWTVDDSANMSLFCQVWPRSFPKRNPKSKWFVSAQMWPERHFPPYCNGPMYVMGKTAGQSIIDLTQIFPPMTIEDLFYTGIIAESAGVRRVNWGRSMLHSSTDLLRGRGKCSATEEPILFSVHSLPNPGQMRKGFRIVKTYKCHFAPSPENATDSLIS